MPLLPIRNLGAAGVITDVDPFNLPYAAFTKAKNVRFTEGNVERAPIFRTAYEWSTSATEVPVFVYGLNNPGSFDTVLVVNEDFDVFEFANGALTTVHSDSQSASTAPVTGTTLASVEYLNRPSRIPIARTPAASTFSNLANWDSTWRTKSLRSFGDFMLALNLTEGSTSYPNRIRFSDITLANNVPGSWDATDTTKSAGFNDLVQLRTPIVDGATLGSNFLIYSSDQVWLMEFVGGTFIFNFRKVFDDAGVINQNCILEVEGKHYVFDRDDIYVNDGITRQSICDNRVRDYIFDGLDMSLSDKCFVLHVSSLEEIYFCYHSGDDLSVYGDASGCNRAAVYNYRSDTWSFVDLPNVTAGALANLDSVETYASASANYSTTGGTFHSQESKFTSYPVFASQKHPGPLSINNPTKTGSYILAPESPDNANLALSGSIYPREPGLWYNRIDTGDAWGNIDQINVNHVDNNSVDHDTEIRAVTTAQQVAIYIDASNYGIFNVTLTNTYSSDKTIFDVTLSSSAGTFTASDNDIIEFRLFQPTTPNPITRPRLLGLDLVNSGNLNLPETTEVSQSVYLERTGIDLDQEAQLPLSSYKVIKSIYPQISTPSTDKFFDFTFGAADLPPAAPSYETAVTFDSSTQYKVDTRMAGRYLSYKMETSETKDFTLSGMDVDIVPTGRR